MMSQKNVNILSEESFLIGHISCYDAGTRRTALLVVAHLQDVQAKCAPNSLGYLLLCRGYGLVFGTFPVLVRIRV